MENLRYQHSEAEAFGRGLHERVKAEAEQLVAELDLARFADDDGFVDVDVAIPFSIRVGASGDTHRPQVCCIAYPGGDFIGTCCPEDMEET